MLCDDDLPPCCETDLSQRTETIKRELRSASKGTALSRSDLLDRLFRPETEDCEHFWVAAGSPASMGRSERYDTQIIRGISHTVPRFMMIVLEGHADFSGRFSCYPGTRQHISGSVEETRNQLQAYMSPQCQSQEACDWVVDNAIIQLQEQLAIFDHKHDLAEWIALNSLAMDWPAWEPSYEGEKKPATWWMSRWGAAHFTQIERSIWASKCVIPAHNGKRLTREMYTSLSSKYQTKKRPKREEELEGESKKLALAGVDSVAPDHTYARIIKDKRTMASDDEDEEEDGRSIKRQTPTEYTPTDHMMGVTPSDMGGVSKAEFRDTRPGAFINMTREQAVEALTDLELLYLALERATAQQKVDWEQQCEELEQSKLDEMASINKDLQTIEAKHALLVAENSELAGTTQQLQDQIQNRDSKLILFQEKAKLSEASNQVAIEGVHTEYMEQLNDEKRLTSEFKEKLRISRGKRDLEMQQFQEALELATASRRPPESPASRRPPESPPTRQEMQRGWEGDAGPGKQPVPAKQPEMNLGADPDQKPVLVLQTYRQLIPGYDLIDMHPLIAEHTSGIFYNEHELSVQQLTRQILGSQNAVMAEMSYMVSKGEDPSQIKDSMRTHLEILNEVSLAYTAKWFSYPITKHSSDRQSKYQMCAQCGTTPGNWTGAHKNKSRCHATKCARCHTLGLGVMGSKDSCNVHPTEKCPFADENILLFCEYVLRRLHHDLKDVAEASLTGDFMNSFNK
jgi:hypothetical protein